MFYIHWKTIEVDNTAKYRMGKTYPCRHCGKRFTILETRTGSVLPAEGKHDDPYFDPEKHVSHLKNCEKRREDWGLIKGAMRNAYLDNVKKAEKDLRK